MNKPGTILVVEDQPAMLDNLRVALEMAGYPVLTARDGLEAIEVLAGNGVDLILADVAMPRMNGYQLYERLCQEPEWAAIPFILVTARALDSDVRYGKELGVDDYLTKPVQLADLLATVQGKLRRARVLAELTSQRPAGPLAAPDTLAVGGLRIEIQQRRVLVDGQEVRLSQREFALLAHLARHADQVVSLPELCRVTHGLQADPVEAGNLVYSLVRTLRSKLGRSPAEAGYIETVRGVGYRLAAPRR